MENDLINNIKTELCKIIKGDIVVEEHISPGNFIHVLTISIKYNSNRDIFVTSFSLDYFGVDFYGDYIIKSKKYEEYIVKNVYDRYRSYILGKYFKEV